MDSCEVAVSASAGKSANPLMRSQTVARDSKTVAGCTVQDVQNGPLPGFLFESAAWSASVFLAGAILTLAKLACQWKSFARARLL